MPDRAFDLAVTKIYDAALSPALWPEALQAITDCLGDVGTILIYGREDGTFGIVESPALSDCISEYRVAWADRDLRAIRCRERGFWSNRDVITDRDVIEPEEMKAQPLYADFLPRHGLKFFAVAMVSPDPRVEVGLSVQRAHDKPEYSEQELEVVGRLGAHVEKALRLSLRLMDAELINVGLGSALARIGIGVFALDSLGRVIFSNDAGQALLGDGIELVDGRLRILPGAGPASANGVLSPAASDLQDLTSVLKPTLIRRQRSHRPLALYALPISTSSTMAHEFLTHARTIVVLIDSDIADPPDPSILRDILGLTLGEARIASLVGTGISPRGAAEKLGIAEETVRSTLKRVFSKVGVSRQNELAALMTRLVLR
jgi:DNA-binding CsgD family transcriptional regulator/PAS domain-containing protein